MAASKRQAQADATRRAIIRAARRLFATRGYAATSIDDILARTKLARGALYHHFASKREILEAVFEDVDRDLNERVRAVALAERRPERRLAAGCEAFLDACLDREVQRIVLLDGPSVLGWQTCYDIDGKYALGSLEAALSAAIEAGLVEPQPVAPLAVVLLGALNQAALAIARADDVAAARDEMGRTVARLLDGLAAR